MVAAVTAIPAIGLCKSAKADPLLKVIGRYRAEIAAASATHGLSDEELDAWIDRADAILMEAVDLPVLTEASALAVISLFIDDGWMLSQHRGYGDEFKALVGRRETTSPQPFKLRPGDAERGRPQLIYLKRAASGAYPRRAPGASISSRRNRAVMQPW